MWGIPFENQHEYLSSALVSRLNKIVESTNCHVVISSAWRADFSIEEIKGFLSTNGFSYPDRVIGVTPINRSSGGRGSEIHQWMHNNETPISYAIVDDIAFDIEESHPNRFVKTDSHHGLTEDDAHKVIEILNNIG